MSVKKAKKIIDAIDKYEETLPKLEIQDGNLQSDTYGILSTLDELRNMIVEEMDE
jgi:hypothetical protein